MSKPALRVWWIPQVPGTPFYTVVKDVDDAILLLTTLANYDAFQFEHNIKPDYCNAGGLEEWDSDEGEWFDWESIEGDGINDVMRYEAEDNDADEE